MLSSQVSKRNRFGILAKAETICLDINVLLISAALEPKTEKIIPLNSARIQIELLKRLFRMMHELAIIKSADYIEIETALQEISRMANGWLKYVRQAPR